MNVKLMQVIQGMRQRVPPDPPGGTAIYGLYRYVRCEAYGFQGVYSSIGYTNLSFRVQNRVSFFTKLTSWFKILSSVRKLRIVS